MVFYNAILNIDTSNLWPPKSPQSFYGRMETVSSLVVQEPRAEEPMLSSTRKQTFILW